jgi:hypothetical protein
LSGFVMKLPRIEDVANAVLHQKYCLALRNSRNS